MSDGTISRLDFGGVGRRRLPLVLQTEAAECGLACLAMVAGFHGHDIDLASLRARFSISLKGVTLSDLMGIAAALDLAARPLRGELDDLAQLPTPCLLHWDLNHFVVLKSANARHVVIHDPAFGERRLSVAEASRHFTGVVLELTPTPTFVERETKQTISLSRLVGNARGLGAAVAQVLLLALVLEAFALLSPLFMQWVVDQAIVAGDRGLLGLLAVGFLLLGVIQGGITLLRGWTVLRLGTSLNVQWFANVFAHLIRLPVGYFEKRHLGDVVSRFGAIETIQRTLTGTFVEALLDGLMALTTLAMMAVYSGALSTITLTAVAIYAVLRLVTFRAMRQLTEEQIVIAAKRDSALLESIRGIQSIRLFGRENDRQARWMNLMVEATNRGLGSQKLSLGVRGVNMLLFLVENVTIVYFGATAVLDRHLSLGMLFAFLAYKATFATRVSALVDRSVDVRMLRLQAERLADIVLTPRDQVLPTTRSEGATRAATIEVRDLRFRYADNEPWVLDGVSFSVQAGEAVAIVGPSGCGKTTLVKVMLGLLKPNSGDVLIDGVSIFNMAGSARGGLAAVMQEDQLFAGSIAENLSFFDAHPNSVAIERCARLAAIHDDIARMAMGYQTLVGDMGTVLSGGQKQRLLLARALYSEPRVLFLDEATSHLDVDNERLVCDAVRRLSPTRVIIAHRPETIRHADRCIVLDQVQTPHGANHARRV